MSIKEEFKNGIIIKLVDLGLDKTTLSAINGILLKELQNYDVTRTDEQLPTLMDNENEQILKLFLCTKCTKLSKKTVKMYMYSIRRLLEFTNKSLTKINSMELFMELDLLLENFRNKLVDAINDSKLPPCVAQYVLSDVLEECKEVADKQLQEKKLRNAIKAELEDNTEKVEVEQYE